MEAVPETCCGNPSCDGTTCHPAPTPITMDQARIQVGRAIAKNLRSNIAAVEATPSVSEIDSANKLLVVAAAKELHDSVLLLVKRLERPRILRPDRSVKIARRS